MKIPAIAFVGRQNSGKTVLLEKLIARLSDRGLAIGTLKHHSHPGFDFDIPGKDSWRHAQAGSRLSVVSAPDKIAIVRQLDSPLPLDTTLAAMIELSAASSGSRSLDAILVEGFRHSDLPTVELFRAANPKDAERELDTANRNVIAVVTDIERIIAAAAAQNIPSFAFEQTEEWAEFLLNIVKP